MNETPPKPSAPPVAPVADSTVPGLEFKARLLVAFMGLLLAGSVLFLLFARGAFDRTQELVLIADDSEGVSVGTDLSFSGFPIGRVRRIALAPDGSVRIIVDVPVADARWLRESSVFVLTRSLVGGTSLRAYSGVLDDPPLPPGAERRVLFGDATAEIPQLVASVRSLLANLTAITASDSALVQSLAEVRTLTQRLNGPGGALGVALGDAEQAQKLVGRLDGALARSDALLTRLDGTVARADQQLLGPDGVLGRADRQILGPEGVLNDVKGSVAELQGLLADTRASLQKVNGVLDEAQGIAVNVRGATVDLDQLRGEVDASLRRVDQLIGDVNRRWPFARDTELKLP
jgi:phospholipid/cholesterol/gamma-HCH transport system substrate-binding protein